MNISYIRISTIENNECIQIEALKNYNIDKQFIDKESAKDINRPQLKAMLEFVKQGDTVFVYDFLRIASTTKDLVYIINKLNNKGVRLVFLKESLDTSTEYGKIKITMLDTINEFEKSSLLERQKEGIIQAKEEGKYKGRQEITDCSAQTKVMAGSKTYFMHGSKY